MNADNGLACAMLRACIGLTLLLCGAPAWALAQRTFVASNGDDLHACTLVQPCRSFGRAITQTAANGEIIVLDSAGYGAVTIDKSISIVAPAGIYAGISVFANDGVTVDAPSAKVVLRGLTINGQGGVNGIRFVRGDELLVDGCVIASMSGAGILADDAGSHLSVANTSIFANHSGIEAFGIELSLHDTHLARNADAGVNLYVGARMRASRVVISGNGGDGIGMSAVSAGSVVTHAVVDSSTIAGNLTGFRTGSATAGSEMHAAVTRSSLANNAFHGAHLFVASGAVVRAHFSDNQIASNAQSGIFVEQFGTALHRVTLSGNHITRNNKGISVVEATSGNASVATLQDNFVRRNASIDIDGTLTPVSPL